MHRGKASYLRKILHLRLGLGYAFSVSWKENQIMINKAKIFYGDQLAS